MKYLGQKPRRCGCRYCTGDNDSKPVLKAIKHGARQKARVETKNELRLTDRIGKKRIR